MENLKRRDFLKMIGIAIVAPTALVKTNLLTHPVDILLDLGMPNGKVMKEMRKFCEEVVYKVEPFDSNGLEIELSFPSGTIILDGGSRDKNA